MFPVGSQDWVISKLKGSRSKFWDIPEQALKTYNSIDPVLRLPLNARAVANNLNCYVLDEAKKAFEGMSNSRFEEKNGTTYHHLNDCALWYKQLGDDGLPSNYPTETAKELMQGAFPWAPKKVLLVVGFEFDEMLQRLERVEIQRFNSANKIQFHITLEKVVPARVLAMPSKTATPTRTKVAIRRSPEQDELKVGEE
jgi:hypothetical protein